jgi:hypothetical protein
MSGYRGAAGQRPTSSELRRGERAASGTRHDAPPVKPKMRIISGKPIVRGALRFVGKIGLPFGGGELEIADVMLFSSHGKSWANLPSKPVLDQNGVHKTGESRKKAYAPFLEWSSKELRDRFSTAVVYLVKEQFPGSLDGAP